MVDFVAIYLWSIKIQKSYALKPALFNIRLCEAFRYKAYAVKFKYIGYELCAVIYFKAELIVGREKLTYKHANLTQCKIALKIVCVGKLLFVNAIFEIAV